jgi:hypothetical protein
MGTPAQNYANFQNAFMSTGPKSAGGKARSRFNAVKHGLSKPVLTDRWSIYEVDTRVARLLGQEASIDLMLAARRLVEATMYCERVQTAKRDALKAAAAQRKEVLDEFHSCAREGVVSPELADAVRLFLGSREETMAEWAARVLSECYPAILRYQRRAASALKTAQNRFDALAGRGVRPGSEKRATTNPKKTSEIKAGLAGLAERALHRRVPA